ncbi:GTPase HflX [Orrella sp. 11846]|uniref:GTPase HflX n=1 Tax=Orrella sp. 11846 TaxID=3409913 RepID=UPI003B59618D
MQALLIGVDLGHADYIAQHEEFALLATSAGAEILADMTARRDRPDPTYFIGSGKVEEARMLCEEYGVNIVLFDQPLSPAQQRNLERQLNVRVVDRVALILDIFALRAKSHEGKLQVELAQLQHLSTRLTRLWTHLERQQGGIGTRGPGEAQLELDRRMIGAKIKMLKQRLDKVQRQRATQRRSRARSGSFSASLVGYTNAGKSTLFNALTRSDAYVADQLFATLDTTTRRVWIEDAQQQVTLSDTVGFIRDLPHTLIAAFRATLEEAIHADLLLHVIDASSPERDAQTDQVQKVLSEIGLENVPQVYIYNKIDLAGLAPGLVRDEHGTIRKVYISAEQRQGLELVRQTIAEFASSSGNYEIYNENFQSE